MQTTETLDNYPFCGNNPMELEYHSHIIDSDMTSADDTQSTQFHYDQVMMAFEHQDQQLKSDVHHQLEIEMLDDSSAPSPLVTLLELVQPNSPTQSSSSPHHDLVDSNERSPSNLPPLQVNLDHNPGHQSPCQSMFEGDVALLSAQSLQPPSVETLPSNLQSDPLSHSTCPQATPGSSAELLSIVEPTHDSSIEASSSEATLAYSSASPSTAIAPTHPAHIEPAPLDGDQNIPFESDHVPRLPDNSVERDDPESNQHAEEEPGCQAQCDNNRLVDEIPYDEYELDSRPKVRTELLEHVRVEFESVSLNDQGLLTELDPSPAPGVRLICEGCEYSLFQRMRTCTNPDSSASTQASIDDETVLLSEPEGRELYYGPLEAFIQSLHNIFPNFHNDNKNEIVLNFPALEIKVPEDNIYSKEISLFDVDRLHIGAGLPDRLLISLEKQPRLVHRFNVLAAYVSELVENNPNVDGNSGEVFIENDSGDPADHLTADKKDDADRAKISHESSVPEELTLTVPLDSPAYLASTASAVDKPDMFSTVAEESQSPSARIVAASPGHAETSNFSHAVDSSLSSALTHVVACNSAGEELGTTAVDLAVTNGCSATQPTESPQLPEDTDKSTNELTYDPDHKSLQTLTEGVYEHAFPDQAVRSSPEVSLLLDNVQSSQACTKDTILNSAESCSTSERTITGLDQLSEGEIEEFVEEGFGAPSGANPPTLVDDPNSSRLNEEPASDVTVADCDKSSSDLLAPVPNGDCITTKLHLSSQSPSQVGSKRNHPELEDSAESFEQISGTVEASSQNSDLKKARVL